MKTIIQFLVLVFLASLAAQAQRTEVFTVAGTVLDAETKQAIPYANIGIPNTEVGTLSGEDGSFLLKVPVKYKEAQLTFSSLGYKERLISIRNLNPSEHLEVLLSEQVSVLGEVTIFDKKLKKQEVTLGNRRSILLNGFLTGDSVHTGAAVALQIDKSQYPELSYIKKAKLYIAINRLPSFKIRMRILAVDSANERKPGRDLLLSQVITESSIKKGWLTFNTPPFSEVKEDAFFLAFEWIITKKEREQVNEAYDEYIALHPDRVRYDTTIVDGVETSTRVLPRALAGTFFGVTSTNKSLSKFPCYSRDNSFGAWKRMGDVLSAKIELANYPKTTAPQDTAELSLERRINQWAAEFREVQGIPGLQIAVIKRDSLLYSRAFGFSDKEKKRNAKPNTQFRIASVSKTQTAIAVMKLASAGKIDLDKDVRHYVPSFPQKKYSMTVRQLLSHLGGVRDYYEKSLEEEIFIQQHYESLTEALSLFSQDTLVAKPGSKFVYSSFGYILLGAVIESVTRQPYLQYMKKEIWQPLHMSSTYGEVADSVMVHKSKFYYFSEEEAKSYDLSYSYSSGGLLSTSEDLVRFGAALLGRKLLRKDFIEQIFTTQYTAEGKPTGYGLGWYVGKDANENEVWYHAGELPSSGAMLLIYPKYKLVIALLANSPIISDADDGFSEEIQRLGELIYK